jgi:hypothetical protein
MSVRMVRRSCQALVHRCDLDPLARGVGAADGGAEGDDVHARILGADDAAFQAGMDHL